MFTMTIFDFILLLFILLGGFVGFKRGLTTQLVSTVGFVVIIIISYLFKGIVASFMYNNLPFFDFGGIFKGLSVLNILVYEIIAFLTVFSVLMIIFQLVLRCTRVFETILKFTIVLGIPSKIAGAIVGIIENYVIVFIFLYIISLPTFNIKVDSNFKNSILNNTPVLNHTVENSVALFTEFKKLKDKYEDTTNPNDFNKETLNLLLKYKITDVDSVKVLVEKDKIKIEGIDEVLSKYEKKD